MNDWAYALQAVAFVFMVAVCVRGWPRFFEVKVVNNFVHPSDEETEG